MLLPNSGSERVVRIVLEGLHRSKLVATENIFALVRVEHHVDAIRKVVGIHRHTLEVVRTIDHDANLSILGTTQREIIDSAAKLNDTIHVSTTLFRISYSYSRGVNTLRRLDAEEGATTIFGVALNGLDLTRVDHNIFVLGSRRSQNLDKGFVVCTKLVNLDVVKDVSLFLKHGDRSSKLLLADSKVEFVAETDIDHALLIELIFEEVRSGVENILLGLISRIQQVPHRRLWNAHTLTDGDIGHALLTKPESLGSIRLTLSSLLDSLARSKLSSSDTKVPSDLGLRHTTLLEIVDDCQEVLVALIGILTRAPRISSGSSNHTFMVQLLEIREVGGFLRVLMRDLVSLRKLELDLMRTIPEG